MGAKEQEEIKKDVLEKLLKEEDTEGFREEFMDLHPYDQAVFFTEEDDFNRMRIYSYLSPEEVSEIMENIDLERTEKYITEMDPHFASMVFAEMAVDDAVD